MKKEPHWKDSIVIEDHGYKIFRYKFAGDYNYEVHYNGTKLPGVWEYRSSAEQWCKNQISMNVGYLLNN